MSDNPESVAGPASNPAPAPAADQAKATLLASLFDLRSVIGLLFTVYGTLLTILGLVHTPDSDRAMAGGIALNLWSGVVMLAAGICFFGWVWAKPPLPPAPGDAAGTGGPPHH